MNTGRRSLFGRMLASFIVVMLCIWGSVLVWNIYQTQTEHKSNTEQEAKILAQQLLAISQSLSDRPEDIGIVAKKMIEARDGYYTENNFYAPLIQIHIWKNGNLLYASKPELPDSIPAHPSGDANHALPMKGLWVGWQASDDASGITVHVIREVIGRYIVTISSASYFLLPLLYSFPLMLIPVFLMIRVGLSPLKSIVSQIEERSASDLTPLTSSPYKELSPLTSSVNHLMKRLLQRLEREKEFLADAAHELKTPLAVIQINAETLNKNRDPEQLEAAVRGLNQGVSRATHTVHQMLALARFDADPDNTPLQAIDLVELIRSRLASAAHNAMVRQIEIELQAPPPFELPMNRESMISLIDNLIDNAIKYSPANSKIMVSITKEADFARLTISDQGPGIPKALRDKAFERFFRVPDQEQEGSGLGLAIAERAAFINHARIRLEAGSGGSGLSAIVEFHPITAPSA